MTAVPPRGRYQGALQVLRYNRRFFLLAGIAAALAAFAASTQRLPGWLAVGLGIFAVATLLGAASSLLVSHYVYDRSELFGWEWLRTRLAQPPASWALVHAGLDEASPALRRLFPAASGEVFDIYDPQQMTEPAIAAARRITAPPEPARRASPGALPLADAATDLALLFFAAHELRRADSREQLFRELRRILHPDGRLVLVEHLRDSANLLAFGPGFLHFLPRREWLRVAQAAGLSLVEECRITPFVRAFFLGRSG